MDRHLEAFRLLGCVHVVSSPDQRVPSSFLDDKMDFLKRTGNYPWVATDFAMTDGRVVLSALYRSS